jgi:hypothetical protein
MICSLIQKVLPLNQIDEISLYCHVSRTMMMGIGLWLGSRSKRNIFVCEKWRCYWGFPEILKRQCCCHMHAAASGIKRFKVIIPKVIIPKSCLTNVILRQRNVMKCSLKPSQILYCGYSVSVMKSLITFKMQWKFRRKSSSFRPMILRVWKFKERRTLHTLNTIVEECQEKNRTYQKILHLSEFNLTCTGCPTQNKSDPVVATLSLKFLSHMKAE